MVETVHDLMAAVAETHGMIAKADLLLKRIPPGSAGPLSHLIEPTLKLRDNLERDLEALERELEKQGL